MCKKNSITMFESDDFDQILSEFDIPKTLECIKENPCTQNQIKVSAKNPTGPVAHTSNHSYVLSVDQNNQNSNTNYEEEKSPNESKFPISKQKAINKIFDHDLKRKFPGPAGILSNQSNNDSFSHMEFLSQDINVNNIKNDLCQSPLWNRLLTDMEKNNIGSIDHINLVKEKSVSKNLSSRKAGIVAAFVEMIDRSAIDPLLILRDNTGSIKCTLHRDAWSAFSRYISSDKCALVLWKPTVLTTGITNKKHYLNITLNNIIALYCSNISNIESENKLPSEYLRYDDNDITIIKVNRTFGLSVCAKTKEVPVDSMSFLKDMNFEEFFFDDI